jgi:hypothetical protein
MGMMEWWNDGWKIGRHPKSTQQDEQQVDSSLSPPRKRGSRETAARMDSRLRGNDMGQ